MGGFDAISAAETECLTAAEQVEREAGRVPNSSRIGRRTKIWILVSVSIVIVTVFVLLGIYVSEHGSVSSNWEEELQSCGFGRIDLDDDTSAVLQIFAPKEYNVSLHFDEELFRVDTLEPVFEGQVRVTVRVHQSVSCLVFHADNLTVDAIGVSEPDTSEVLICSDTKACQYELVLLHKQTGPGQSFEQNLYALHWRGHMFEKGSTYVISFLYRGVVSDKATALGLHRSKHGVCENSAEGNKNAECKEFIAVGSQLERNGARKVFPCLDSPFSKSVFHIRVEAPYDEAPVVLSNGKESHVFNSSDGASRVVVFESTPPMSTYLVAFVSGRFDVVSSRSIEEVQDSVYEVRGWSIRGRDLTTPAVVAGVKALEFYTDMLQIEQPQIAFDFVAFPGRKGAMENWGLLIFDELRLLDRNGSFWHYQMLSVVCHEVAHQWLGNMMTAKNWTQLFLNEGFAVTVEYYCMHHIDSRLSIDVFRFLGISPGGEKQHVHDGIVQNSLQCTDPLLCGPLVPKSDLDLDDSLVYSRGAITLYSLLNEAYLFSTLQDLLKKYSFSTLDITSVIEQHGKSNSNVGLGTLSSMNAMSNTVNSSTGTLAPLLFFPAGLFGVVSNKTGSNGTAIQVRVFCAWNDSHIKNKDIDTAVLEKLRTCEDVLGEMEHHHLDAVPRCGSEHGSTKEYHSSLTAVESNINLHSMTIQYQLDQVSEMIDMLLHDDNPCHFQDFRNKLIFLANLMLDHYEIALIEDSQALRVTLSVLDFIGATIQEFPRGLSEYLLLAPAYQILASLEDLARKSAYIDDDDECALKLQDIFYTLHPEYDADLKMNGKNQEDEYLLHFAHPDVVLRILLYPIQYKSLRNPEEVNHQNVESTNGWITLLCSQSPSTPLFQHYLGEVHGQETPQVSVDLHTAIYGVLSSGLCEKSPSAKDMARALSDCYLGEEDYADASRCLHSIIYVQDYTTIKDTLRSIIATKPHPKSQIVDVYEDVAHTVVLMSWRGGQDGLAKAMSLLAEMGDDVACVALKDIRTPQVASDIDKMSKVIDRYASLCKTSLITSWHGRLVKARASEQNIVHALCAPESGKAR